MLFYVAPFQATFRFTTILFLCFTTTLTTKTTFSVGTANFGDNVAIDIVQVVQVVVNK